MKSFGFIQLSSKGADRGIHLTHVFSVQAFLGMGSWNYIVTSPLIGWPHTQGCAPASYVINKHMSTTGWYLCVIS